MQYGIRLCSGAEKRRATQGRLPAARPDVVAGSHEDDPARKDERPSAALPVMSAREASAIHDIRLTGDVGRLVRGEK